ncbi:MAG: sulfotransferase [Actinobacteria bacterium]|nr:sulfotransferase [Actinomycetota bacterium]
MTARYERPDLVRRINAMAGAVGGGAAMVPLEADELLDRATTSLGLDRFDLDDGDWEGRFRRLVTAVDASRLHVVGRLMTREELLRGLRTRLLLAAHREAEPSVRDERIVAPIVVTGPARSGTTILFELLALDPGLRSPIATEVLHPVPPAGTTPQQRTLMTECEQELWADVQPEFASMHELRSDLPVECITLTLPSFAGSHWAMVLDDFGDWAPEPGPEMAFHRSVLQAAQFGRPTATWILKTPGYVMMLDDLLAAYPDVRIVQTHRDPAKTMPSTVSTAAMTRWLRSDDLDLDGLSLVVGAVFSDALAATARRRRDGSIGGTFGDVRFGDLMTDPVVAIAGAYEQIGRPFTDDHATAITEYLRAKPRGKHGTHHYTAADWGFDADQVRVDLADYLDYFQVALEP